MYQRALLLDPKLYEAALFIGDVYFKTADQVKAVEWFARAVAINPDRETAYRYWGDCLDEAGQSRLKQATSLSKHTSPSLTTAWLAPDL